MTAEEIIDLILCDTSDLECALNALEDAEYLLTLGISGNDKRLVAEAHFQLEQRILEKKEAAGSDLQG